MAFDAADFASFLDPDMPGYALGTLTDGATVGGLFRKTYGDAFGGMVAGERPQFLAPATLSLAIGSTMSINGQNYSVVGIEPTASGLLRYQMEES